VSGAAGVARSRRRYGTDALVVYARRLTFAFLGCTPDGMRTHGLPFYLLLAAGCGASTQTPTTAPIHDDPTAVEAASDSESALRAAVDGPQRTEEDRARDVYRHPVETLAFFGITPDDDILELAPGGGWYTRILAPLVRGAGSLTVALPDGRYGDTFRQLQTDDPALYGDVRLARLTPPDGIELGEPESVDVVLTFRNTHGWVNSGSDRAVYDAVYRVLRPGGTFGVVQHRDAEGATMDATRGYVPEAHVIEVAQQAGFELAGRSDINANPADTRDHPEGVWSLPPVLRGGDVDRDRFTQIGESDRMTLRFVKPANPE
jgi:predicted methyltransferase